MGWWSATVLGGDAPLDHLNEIVERIGGRFDADAEGDDHCNVYTREQLEENFTAAVEYCNGVSWDRNVAWQVLGHMVLRTGADLPEEARATMIEAAENDEWASEGDSDRVRHMTDLIRALEAHQPGRQTYMKSEGLFEVVLAGMSRVEDQG